MLYPVPLWSPREQKEDDLPARFSDGHWVLELAARESKRESWRRGKGEKKRGCRGEEEVKKRR